MSFSPEKLDQNWPSQLNVVTLRKILEETRGREILLEERIRQMEQRYDCSPEELEAGVARGKGRKHPDWEDSIEWRNAVAG